jgi:hypothetical protein
MALSTLRPRMSLLPSRPVSEPTSIRNLMGDYGGQVELRPIYQRDIRWKRTNMCDLIATIMNEGLIPGLILYKLQLSERHAEKPYLFEMVDGQHRFFTVQKFFRSEPVTEAGGKPFLITWVYRNTSGRDIHIFYKENDATKEWISQNRHSVFSYMTEEEKDAFNSFKLDVKEIKDPLSVDQRRSLFVSLQRGVVVRGSDLLKNMVDVRIIRFIVEEMRLESRMKEILENRCWMNPKNYWLHWTIRFFLMLNPTNDSCQEEQFIVRDSLITTMIKDESPRLESTSEQEEMLEESLERFFAFLDSFPKGVKMSPCHFYALFVHLHESEDGREDILRGHINEWANNSRTKEFKKAWENRKSLDNDEERCLYFLSCKEELDSIRIPARGPEARKTIPKKLRLQVWKRDFEDVDVMGTCYCCGDEISFDKNYEAGHIIAHAKGGSDTADNLRPVCQCCNRSMYMQNMDEFKRQYFS